VFREQGAKGFGANQGSIAGKNDEIFGVADGALGDEHRVAGAVLRVLKDRGDAERLDGGDDLAGLMADHRNDFLGAEGKAGADDMIDERTSPGGMENLGKRGFKARTPASGEDKDGNVFIGHSQSIVPL